MKVKKTKEMRFVDTPKGQALSKSYSAFQQKEITWDEYLMLLSKINSGAAISKAMRKKIHLEEK